MFILAHLSDIHLAPMPTPHPLELLSKRGLGYINWLRKRRYIHRPEVLTAVTADLARQHTDHIAVTGDLVNLSLSNEYPPGRAFLDSLGPPDHVSFVPGNHDTYLRRAIGEAARHWRPYMIGDLNDPIPFVRRRGPVALIGLSTSVPTPPLSATGRLGVAQLETLGALLELLARESLFRVVLLHHPPLDGTNPLRELKDVEPFRDVIRQYGAELILHGHLHEDSLLWLAGPRGVVPCVGVPSASCTHRTIDQAAGYNLYEIDGRPGDWRCTVILRGLNDEGTGLYEERRQILIE